MMNRRVFVALLSWLILLLPLPTVANRFPKTESEFAKLPPICKARMQETKARRKDNNSNYYLWRKRLGSDFIHVHHYCAGLNILNKSWGVTDSKNRDSMLKSAIGEISYTQKHTSPKFFLQSEMAFSKGSILILLNNSVAAHKEFRKGIQLNPKYSRNYSALSDLYKKQGNIEEARYILEQGLTYSPKSKGLNRRLKKLDKTNSVNPNK